MRNSEEHCATVNLENVDSHEGEDYGQPVCLMFENDPPRPPTEKELLLITKYLDTPPE